MRKLRSFGVNSDMLVTFYNALIGSIIMFIIHPAGMNKVYCYLSLSLCLLLSLCKDYYYQYVLE